MSKLVNALTPIIHEAVANAIKGTEIQPTVPLSGLVLNNNRIATNHGNIEDLYANEPTEHGES